MNAIIPNRGLAKARFFAVYGLSVLIIVLLLSSFLKPVGPAESNGALVATGGAGKTVDQVLHQRMEPLQAAALSYIERGRTEADLQRVKSEKALFLATIDSIRKSLDDSNDAGRNAEVETTLATFTLAAERESRLVNTFSLPDISLDKGQINPGGNEEIEALKKMLAEKESKIVALEQQANQAIQEKNTALAALRSRPSGLANTSSPKNDAAAAEWKEKYNKLKTATEKNASQLDALKASYKEVVDDNRRLITQLQAARAGKN